MTRLRPDSVATAGLRALVRARLDLTGHRLAIAHQLRAPLLTAVPAVAELVSELDSPVSRAFIADDGPQDALDALTETELSRWLTAHRYTRKPATRRLQDLRQAAPGISGPAGQALTAITMAYRPALTAVLEQQLPLLEQQIAAALHAHLDQRVFTSLPRSGPVRAARLLAEIGDARGRFPTPAS